MATNTVTASQLPSDCIIIAVMGVTGAGKSTFIQYATTGSLREVPVGHELRSCTTQVNMYPIPGTRIYLVDTPGFDDTHSTDSEILELIDKCLADCFHQKWKISGVIYIHAIIEARMKGSMLKQLTLFRKMIGDKNLSQCCLLTSKWSLQEPMVSEGREAELREDKKYWKPIIKEGAWMERFGDSSESAWGIIKQLSQGSGFIPLLTKETQQDGKRLGNTKAGKEVNDNLEEMRKHHESELKDLNEQLKQAKQENDKVVAEMAAEEKRRREEDLRKIQGGIERLNRDRQTGEVPENVACSIAYGGVTGAAIAATVLSGGLALPITLPIMAWSFVGFAESTSRLF